MYKEIINHTCSTPLVGLQFVKQTLISCGWELIDEYDCDGGDNDGYGSAYGKGITLKTSGENGLRKTGYINFYSDPPSSWTDFYYCVKIYEDWDDENHIGLNGADTIESLNFSLDSTTQLYIWANKDKCFIYNLTSVLMFGYIVNLLQKDSTLTTESIISGLNITCTVEDSSIFEQNKYYILIGNNGEGRESILVTDINEDKLTIERVNENYDSGTIIGYLQEYLALVGTQSTSPGQYMGLLSIPETQQYLIDDYTKLMLHMEPEEFIDSSFSNHSITNTMSGESSIATFEEEGKYGYCGSFVGDWSKGSKLQIVGSTDFQFDTEPFTIDFWIKWTELIDNSHTYFFSTLGIVDSASITFGKLAKTGFPEWVTFGHRLIFTVLDMSRTRIIDYKMTDGWEPEVDTWYHFALVRNETHLYIFIDGISQILSVIDGLSIGTKSMPNSLNDLNIPSYVNYFLHGCIDEFRVSKGIARWTSNFTPVREKSIISRINISPYTNLVQDIDPVLGLRIIEQLCIINKQGDFFINNQINFVGYLNEDFLFYPSGENSNSLFTVEKYDNGTTTSISTKSITDTTKNWTPGSFINKMLVLSTGDVREISNNTSNTISFDSSIEIPSNCDYYIFREVYMNAYGLAVKCKGMNTTGQFVLPISEP